MAADVTREEFEGRIGVFEREVEGEKPEVVMISTI